MFSKQSHCYHISQKYLKQHVHAQLSNVRLYLVLHLPHFSRKKEQTDFRGKCLITHVTVSVTGDIYISDTSSSTATKNFVRDFRKALTTITGVTAKEVPANYVNTLPDERVVCLILVCNNASRLHADIQQSLGYLESK